MNDRRDRVGTNEFKLRTHIEETRRKNEEMDFNCCDLQRARNRAAQEITFYDTRLYVWTHSYTRIYTIQYILSYVYTDIHSSLNHSIWYERTKEKYSESRMHVKESRRGREKKAQNSSYYYNHNHYYYYCYTCCILWI